MAALRGDLRQRIDEGLDAGPAVGLQATEQGALGRARAGHRSFRLAPDVLHLGEFVEHRFAGGGDLMEQGGQAAALRVVDPVVDVEQAPCVVRQQFVARGGDILALDVAAEVEQVGHRAHQFGIADPAHEAGARRARRHVFVGGERGLPDLHLVDAGRVVALGVEEHHAAVVQACVTVREHRRLQPALDHVVDQQRGQAGVALVEDIEHVLAVRRADHPLVLHALHGGVEGLVLAVLQVIAAGENDAVVFRQLDAGLDDRVLAHRLAGQCVVDQPAPGRLAVGQHLQQDQRTDLGEMDLRVVERLRLVLD